MIALDTSALIAIAMKEPMAAACAARVARAEALVVSAGTLAEAMIVAGCRGFGEQMAQLVDGLGAEIVPVTDGAARAVADAYMRFGKGLHPAGLNLGDCFAYALARERDCPLLFVGNDFARTDVTSALEG